ncbi:hypothetical protein L1987_14275 [Smallanthus sonchifolius]|uniref:Uncharacterized protein n=1 Tax=Smallanthus sonchifolius TaxID=185202 RepID=A0ACB9J3Y0_9ASTR|nr:hypothetical protein L1987_14275 [Smallanthus sonchifolius]
MTGNLEEDPFDLDRFIDGPDDNSNFSSTCQGSLGPLPRPPPLPDLNTFTGGNSSKATGESPPLNSNAGLDRSTGNNGDTVISDEIEATIRMGKELGVNMENMDELVRKVIEGEKVTSVDQ